MPGFPASIDLADIADFGVLIEGDQPNDQAGYSVASAGDFNGDGIDDFIVGAHKAEGHEGKAYLLYGRADGLDSLDLGALTAADGIVFHGTFYGDYAGRRVSSAGDINGDGFDDIILGTPYADADLTGDPDVADVYDIGKSYVIFGRATGPADIDLTTIAPADGFTVLGGAAYDNAGIGVSSAGDFNGDGYDDFIIGAQNADRTGDDQSGKAYLIFGKASGFADIDLSSLAATDGFTILGGSNDNAGRSVASAGDVNGDGFDDILVSAPSADSGGTLTGEAYVIFGKASGFVDIDLTALAAADGFSIKGDNVNDALGWSVASAGDINGDGFDDVLLGAIGVDGDSNMDGAAYVIFGKSAGFANIDLTTLVPADGFRIVGRDFQGALGYSVASAGDINGDGFDDVIIGAPDGQALGVDLGEAFVIFGKASGFSTIDLATLSADDGFVIEGIEYQDMTGRSVAGAGDVDGDGLDDMLVGVYRSNVGGNFVGAAYIIFGISSNPSIAQDDAFDTDEATPISGSLFVDNGSGVDVDPNGPLTVATVNGQAGNVGTQIVLASGALLTVETDGSYAYDPNDAFDDRPAAGSGASNIVATDSFTYALNNDGSATVTISVEGLDSHDLLLGTAGTDALAGGIGNDIYVVENGADSVTEADGQGHDTVRASINYVLAAGQSIEALATTDALGTAAINLTGNELANALTGNAGANLLIGGGGIDAMSGGDGDDTYGVDNAGDTVSETNAYGGIDTVRSSIGYTLGANLEHLVLIGTGAINGTGNALDNNLTGNNAANILNGSVGADRMKGDGGDDTYVVDNIGDVVVENSLLDGTDTVRSSLSYGLGNFVENLVLTGTGTINGTGNGLDNNLTGNSAANILNGGMGADRMKGDGGDDTYIVDNVGDVVIENSLVDGTDTVRSSIGYTLDHFVDNLVLTGTGIIDGTGNGLANTLTGNNAANVLNGGAGADQMKGDGGDDTYIVDNVGDVVIENSAADGTDTVRSSVTFSLAGQQLEHLVLTGSGIINGTGNGLANNLTGNGAANILNGAAGADQMKGDAGNDTYVVDNVGDVVIENALADGTDTVLANISYTLGSFVENLTLTGTLALSGTGNSLGNVINGNSAANLIKGMAGADTLSGAGGADTLQGGIGDDQLFGGGGHDDLHGGVGMDGFRFDTALSAANNVDDILDFSVADDTIYLDRDTFTGIAADGPLAAGAFRAGTSALDADDRILFDATTGHLFYDSDGVGGAASILFATVTPGTALTSADFVGYI